MNEWKVIFATIVIFGAGVVTGGLLVNYTVHPHAVRVDHHAPVTVATVTTPTNNPPKNVAAVKPHLPEILSKQFVDQLDCELDLTIGQRADIDRIIADSQDNMRKAVSDVRLESRQKIREKLNPEQKKKFDDLFKQFREQKRSLITSKVEVLSVTSSLVPTATNY